MVGVPASPLAQDKNVILGHLITGIIGIAFCQYIGVTPLTGPSQPHVNHAHRSGLVVSINPHIDWDDSDCVGGKADGQTAPASEFKRLNRN